MSDKGAENLRPRPQAVKVENLTRREAIPRIAAAAVLTVAGAAAVSETSSKAENPSVQATASHKPREATSETPEQLRLSKLNDILQLKLNDPNRKLREEEYAAGAKTLPDIDLGLEVCANRKVREWLREARWKLRTEKRAELKGLSSEDFKWVQNNGIHPEVLAICLDNYNLWLDIMKQYQKKGVYSNSVDYSQMVITPYGMAKMAQTESDGFVNIGKFPAAEEINSEAFTQEYSSFIDWVQSLNIHGAFKYLTNNIPGSENPQTKDSSGGALGPMQIMPSSALGIGQELKDNFPPEAAIPPTNPLNIKWSLLASVILLAEKGYNATDKEKVQEALLKWNNDRSQAEKVLKADYEFRKERKIDASR